MGNKQAPQPAAVAGLMGEGIAGLALVRGSGATLVSGVEYDSRRVGVGCLFVAVEGFESDGHRFVRAAVTAGASAVAVAEGRVNEFMDLADGGTVIVAYADARRALSALSAAWFGHPARALSMYGVTGTNGKTSITYMLESILSAAGVATGVIGTVNYRWGGQSVAAPNTTPESRDLQEMLWTMRRDGMAAVVMEVSSHALDLGRAADIDFDAVMFTNLTRDHLDFHHTFEEYFDAKRRLFTLIDGGRKPRRTGVVNADDPYGRRILGERASFTYPLYSFAVEGEADYRPRRDSIVNEITGLRYSLERPETMAVTLGLAGTFHVYNSLAALAAAHSQGIDLGTATRGLAALTTVPGRFDVIDSGRGYHVVVDYAHTPDALEKLLRSVSELPHGRIITVFGCGGDRDRTKRPLMGRAAADLSDVVIVTSDNPRTEDPDAIIAEIMTGIEGAAADVIPDRDRAIGAAVAMARPRDIVVIAGKGHEDYQDIGKTKIHFDDREVARRHIGGGTAR